MKRAVYSILVTLAAAAVVNAQEGASPITFHVGAGFTAGVGRTGASVNTGWTTSGGIGYNFNSSFGALLDINTSVLGVNSAPFGPIASPGGHLIIFAVTLDPVVHLKHSGRTDIYVTGGGGLFRREFSPALSGFTAISDDSSNKPGIDAGVGIAFGSKWRGKIYAEARYNRIFDNNNLYTNYLPVTLGYRW